MVARDAARSASRGETLVVDVPFPGDAEDDDAFSRADIVFTGVDHSAESFEVRLFLDNPKADAATARTADEGYAGRFHVLGHGGCYGDLGHCDVPAPSTDPTDLRGSHPLTALDTYVTITDPLRALLDSGRTLHTVTLVPIAVTPRRSARRPAPDLLRFADVSLQTYLSAADEAADRTIRG